MTPDLSSQVAAAAPRRTPSAKASPGLLAGAALAKAPATVWSRNAANNSPVTKVLKRDDAIAVDLRPFRMRARQHDQAGAGIGDAEDFRFLAPHHIGLSGFIDVGQAGRKVNAPAIGFDLRQMRGDLMRAGRTFDVSRFAPAVPAADHSRGDDRQRRMSLEPMTESAA